MIAREHGDLGEVDVTPVLTVQLAQALACDPGQRPGFLEPSKHGQDDRVLQEYGWIERIRKDCVECPQGFIRRSWAEC